MSAPKYSGEPFGIQWGKDTGERVGDLEIRAVRGRMVCTGCM